MKRSQTNKSYWADPENREQQRRKVKAKLREKYKQSWANQETCIVFDFDENPMSVFDEDFNP